MSELPYLQEIFHRLRVGYHLSPEDEPLFSALANNPEGYASYFAPLGITLVRHPREFFYFDPDSSEMSRESLPRIAVFSFIFVDHVANEGRPIEEYLLTQRFLLSQLPHFSLDRYTNLLKQVEINDEGGLRLVLKSMERIGWVKFIGEEEFRFLRPFHRVLDKCLDLSQTTVVSGAHSGVDED